MLQTLFERKADARPKRRKLAELNIYDLAKKLDAELSFQVRAGAALSAGSPIIECYTCGSKIHWKRADCGHYIGRHWWGVRWDRRNVRVQCTKCNGYNQGEAWLFGIKLRQEIGDPDFDDLERIATEHGSKKRPVEWFLPVLEVFRAQSKALRQELKAQPWFKGTDLD